MGRIGTINEVIEAWCRGYDEDEHTTTANGSIFRQNGILYDWGYHFPLALKMGRYQLINADKYMIGGRPSQSTSTHQNKVISACYNPVEIPFSALDMALKGKLSMGSYHFSMEELQDRVQIIDSVPDTWIPTGRFNKEGVQYMTHTLGATLITIDDKYFISALDDTAASSHNGYFLTEILGEPETVQEAFEMLKPEEVIKAESNGEEIYRQGEWFFVKREGIVAPAWADKKHLIRYKGDENSHHIATYGFKDGDDQYVMGIVKHTNKEHKMLKLYTDVNDKEWFQAYHNVSGVSYGATGNVD